MVMCGVVCGGGGCGCCGADDSAGHDGAAAVRAVPGAQYGSGRTKRNPARHRFYPRCSNLRGLSLLLSLSISLSLSLHLSLPLSLSLSLSLVSFSLLSLVISFPLYFSLSPCHLYIGI